MEDQTIAGLTADGAALLELGMALGQNHAFGLIAGRCSAAQAQNLRRLREEKLYKHCTEKWEDFCSEYLKISRAEADRVIRLLEEFGPAYFELSQLTRVSPETFRAIAANIEDGVLHFNGEAIALTPDNSRKVAAAVAEMRSVLPKKSSEMSELTLALHDMLHEQNVQHRIDKLAQCSFTILNEFEKLSRDERLGIIRGYFHSTLTMVRDEILRVAAEN